MSPLVYLIRHAEAEHNVEQQYYIRDPELTALGREQALALQAQFSQTPELLVTSPLKRAIETMLLAFTPSKQQIVLMPELQEVSSMPCDTGSSVNDLQLWELTKTVDFSNLSPNWYIKKGMFASDIQSLRMRARGVRQWLQNRPERCIACITHGSFLRYITEESYDGSLIDIDRWDNTEVRAYEFHGMQLVETKESISKRRAYEFVNTVPLL